MYLRNILFNNEALSRFADRYPDSGTAWEAWIAWMDAEAHGLGLDASSSFSYLRDRFHSFHDFAALVGMLRGSAVESESNKRWTSRFIFPFGPNGVYEDLNTDGGREYINFGRTGELLYLMLCRATQGIALREPLADLLAGDNRWNELLGLLQPGPDIDLSPRGNSYLPYRIHPMFDLLSEDWQSVFRLSLPGFDAVPYLVTLGALHMLLYQLTVASEWLGRNCGPAIVCEVVAPKKTPVRELSFVSYQDNNTLTAQALEAYIGAIERSDGWQRALREPGAYAACVAILRERVWWPTKAAHYDGPEDPNALIAGLRETAMQRHRQHAGQVHRSYGRDIGLVSRRGTNKLRYAPTDGLLKALIVANVATRLELNEFLDRLYARYGLVFGEREAARALPADDFDKKAFQANAQRLEQRLGSLGMLRRLSDSCAYVENPYGRRST